MDWKDEKDDRKKYKLYLCSREWSERKEAVKERASGICERCEVLPMNAVHHLKYDNKYNEPLEDLQAICDPCHEFTHAKDDFDPLANARFMDWLSRRSGKPAWLSHGFTIWESFQFPSLQPVLVMWVSDQISYYAQVDLVDNGNLMEGASNDEKLDCIRLSPFEFHIASEVEGNAIKDFYHWLACEGPTEFPHGSKKAFDRCIELSESLRKE